MRKKSIQEILPLVETPSRYLGTEFNSIHKNLNKVKLRLVLAFPDLYEIGSSHFGLQILYSILNERKEIAAERVFAPAIDMEAQLRKNNLSLFSLENKKPIGSFDILGFSLLYELNYTNVVNMLQLSGLPTKSEQRNEGMPLVIAGGPCTCNPEPVADFFDAMVIGDGENVILAMCEAWMNWKDGKEPPKRDLLRAWSEIEGVYIPSFFKVSYDYDNRQVLVPINKESGSVRRQIVPDLDRVDFPIRPIVPFGKPVHDRLRLEVSRGCTRGCRFCQAGMIYRPVRERSAENILSICDQSLERTGYEDISLLSLSTGDYSCIAGLMELLMQRHRQNHVAVSLPSLRAGTIDANLMKLIRKVRKTGFTIAPEAGSQRLRNVINKNINKTDIIDTVKDAFKMGWRLIKLYFMVGLPSETDEDLEEIVALVDELHGIARKMGRKNRLNVSLTTFIPKPHTPFQWEAQITLDEALRKINWLKSKLRRNGIQIKWQQPEVSLVEGLMSRGDRRMADLILAAHARGCKFDGWSDHFKFDLWKAALTDCGIEPEVNVHRQMDMEENLPWDHLDLLVEKEYLQRELKRSMSESLTGDCRWEECNSCGSCDFKNLLPDLKTEIKIIPPSDDHHNLKKQPAPKGRAYNKYMLGYKKREQARFFGHLEMVKLFIRAIRRAKLDVAYSKGFHPMPKVSFENPLPLGTESTVEKMYLVLKENIKPNVIVETLRQQLPKGLEILECRRYIKKANRLNDALVQYKIEIKDGFLNKKQLESFFKEKETVIIKHTKKDKQRRIDLKDVIDNIRVEEPHMVHLTSREGPGLNVRPTVIIEKIFQLPMNIIKTARIEKIAKKPLKP
jgi:radical SAM family uncharacterized protein/radical SAM-linked protein